MERRLDDKHISLNVTQSAKDYLINNGYDEVYGARPLKRFVQKKLETLIAKNILAYPPQKSKGFLGFSSNY